ncbi:MAG: ABC transporter ATP-binding protein, partial [Candidatus Schekmanbacteria bacterium]
METLIEFKDVSKIYRKYSRSLKETLSSFLKKKKDPSNVEKSFKALNNVSFNVKSGKALGIIGPNGAGKSTILKILAGITEASSGEVIIKGKIGALLELGAGFHPEFTGRENIYLNGSIMGMKR